MGGVGVVGVVGVVGKCGGAYICAATCNRPKRAFQTIGLLRKIIPKTPYMDTAETDETGFWRFCHYATGEISEKYLG